VVPVPSSHNERTIIGEDVIIEGTISGAGNIFIDGQVKGNVDVQGHSIVIGQKGQFKGEILARDARVSGRLGGKITALESVNITCSAEVSCDIKAGRIAIDDGAFFEGKIELDREPDRKAGPTDREAGKTSAAQNKPSGMSAAG
jgi:cytoskeletal protein CcmA (bactofilin family)